MRASAAEKLRSHLGLITSQIAIRHFIDHHKDAIPASMHLQFVKHLAHIVSEAEMYIALDDSTREAFVIGFACGC